MKQLCNACPRRCNSLRSENSNQGGYCGMPLFPVVALCDLHYWEEPCISGKNGSGTIFFSGCSLSCVYCQNYSISHNRQGVTITPERLAEIFKELENKGANNINFVNPTHFVWAIKQALKIYKPKIPLVYNSGGYDLPEVIKENIFDIYLIDLKYISSEKSLKYSNASNYFEYASESIKEAYKIAGNAAFNQKGIMQKGLIIRHLILPLATKEAMKIIDFVKENTPNAYFSLMAQYFPTAKAENFKELNRTITNREYQKVVDYIIEKQLKNVFVQELESATDQYVPNFNGKGVENNK